jgi:hypothetical protein
VCAQAFNLVKNRRYIIKPNPQLVAKVRASMSSMVKPQPDSAITADGTPELYIWDDKRKKERRKKEKEKEKRTEKAKDPVSPDEVEHTAFNPLVFNRQIQEVRFLDPCVVCVCVCVCERERERAPLRSLLRACANLETYARVVSCRVSCVDMCALCSVFDETRRRASIRYMCRCGRSTSPRGLACDVRLLPTTSLPWLPRTRPAADSSRSARAPGASSPRSSRAANC